MEDRVILQMLLDRVEAVFSALAARFGSRLNRTAMNILESRQDAEECVNDTYLAVWNAIPPAEPDPLTPYVLRTGKNIALNRLRARTTRKRGGYELSLEELSGCVPAPERDWELGRELNRWLGSLKRKDRVLFLRRYWFGDSVRDIAAALDITENAASVRLHRLRNQLKEHLTKEGYYE